MIEHFKKLEGKLKWKINLVNRTFFATSLWGGWGLLHIIKRARLVSLVLSSHYKWLPNSIYSSHIQHPATCTENGKCLKWKIISTIQLVSSFISPFRLDESTLLSSFHLLHTPTLQFSVLCCSSHSHAFFQMICCTTLTTSSSRVARESPKCCCEMRNWKMAWNFSHHNADELSSHKPFLFFVLCCAWADFTLVQCDLMKNFVFVSLSRPALVVVVFLEHITSSSHWVAYPTPHCAVHSSPSLRPQSTIATPKCVCVCARLCLSYFHIHKSLCWCFYRESHTIFKEWMIKDFINIFIGN